MSCNWRSYLILLWLQCIYWFVWVPIILCFSWKNRSWGSILTALTQLPNAPCDLIPREASEDLLSLGSRAKMLEKRQSNSWITPSLEWLRLRYSIYLFSSSLYRTFAGVLHYIVAISYVMYSGGNCSRFKREQTKMWIQSKEKPQSRSKEFKIQKWWCMWKLLLIHFLNL